MYRLQTPYDAREPNILMNGTKISLHSWKYLNKLNSHNVVAPITTNKYEVSGYVDYKYGLRPETTWEVILPDGSNVWYEDVEVRCLNTNVFFQKETILNQMLKLLLNTQVE